MRLSPSETSIGLQETPDMDRNRYQRGANLGSDEPLLQDERPYDEETDIEDDDDVSVEIRNSSPFSWIEYGVFLLLGVAMLWAWNMFLAAAPYFQNRFRNHEWLLNHFQPAEVSMLTVGNLATMLILSNLQKNASYPKRISVSLVINLVAFTILALSTLVYLSANVYFGFLMVVILASAVSSGLIQNGVFAFTAGFGRTEYTQAIMTGQAVAGVLPPLTQIISTLAVADKDQDAGGAQSPKSAFIYFLTASVISVFSLLAFLHLLRRRTRYEKLKADRKPVANGTSEGDIVNNVTDSADAPNKSRKSIPLKTLFRKLRFLSLAVFVCFAVTMVFPVFTTSIESVNGIDSAVFIPTAFLLWNMGDLLGRLLPLIPQLLVTHHPFALFCAAMARLLFVPLYLTCNVKGRGASISSDVFYLVIVQFLFGLSNGYVGSLCMMSAGDWVAPDEREAAGSFMALSLIGGLAAGSLLSFLFGDI